jgi:hypothetical protein
MQGCASSRAKECAAGREITQNAAQERRTGQQNQADFEADNQIIKDD